MLLKLNRCDGAAAGRETWTQTSCRVLRSWCKDVNHYTGEGHQFTENLVWELTLHPSHTSPPTEREGSTARTGGQVMALPGEEEGAGWRGEAWRWRCCKWNRGSEGCVVQKLRRIVTCSSCVFRSRRGHHMWRCSSREGDLNSDLL